MHIRIVALSLAQCCYWFATLVGISLSAIVGLQLSPHAELATLPFALASLGGLLSTYSLSTYMQRFGRRAGLRLGTAAGLTAALLSSVALQLQSFWLFCFASLLMGCYQASSAYYRLAAMDEASGSNKSAAMSWVLCGGLVAAFIGPTSAKIANTWEIGATYTGPYLLVVFFAFIGYLSLGLLSKDKSLSESARDSKHAALPDNFQYWLGVVNTGFAQFLMMLMMVIAPLAMRADGFAISVSLSVIGWHIIGMFLPSFFSGKMIDRWGESKVLLLGYSVYGLGALAAVSGNTAAHYYSSLFLLGIAWNFVYMAGTTQYNNAITAENKGKSQGFAELSVALAGTIAVFTGGVMINHLNWPTINRLVILLLLLLLASNLVLRVKHQGQQRRAQS